MNEQEDRDKVIVITGSSSGFGRACSAAFTLRGASVVLSEDVDVTQAQEVLQLTSATVARYGRIDVWVNLAGSGAVGLFDEIPLADHVRVMEHDLMATLYGSYYAMSQFRRQGSGVLINVASVVGKVPAPYVSSYVAAQHAVVGLSASMRQELHQANVNTIHVCTVMPATFDSTFYEHAGSRAGSVPDHYDPEEVAQTIVNLASDPKDEVSVGSAAKVSIVAHNLFPGLVESLMARQTHKAESEAPDNR